MENEIDINAAISITGAIITIIGVIVAIVKLGPELKEKKANTISQIAEASESLATGAKVSNEFLLERIVDQKKLIDELKGQIEDEKKIRERDKKETAMVMEELRRQQIATDKIVIEQRREIVEWQQKAERWQDYATRLSYQVMSYKGIPIPFEIVEKDQRDDKKLSDYDA